MRRAVPQACGAGWDGEGRDAERGKSRWRWRWSVHLSRPRHRGEYGVVGGWCPCMPCDCSAQGSEEKRAATYDAMRCDAIRHPALLSEKSLGRATGPVALQRGRPLLSSFSSGIQPWRVGCNAAVHGAAAERVMTMMRLTDVLAATESLRSRRWLQLSLFSAPTVPLLPCAPADKARC